MRQCKEQEDGSSAECGVTAEDVLRLEVLLKTLGLSDSNQKYASKKVQSQKAKLFFPFSDIHFTFWTRVEEFALNNSHPIVSNSRFTASGSVLQLMFFISFLNLEVGCETVPEHLAGRVVSYLEEASVTFR